jgi:hypothetical protein
MYLTMIKFKNFLLVDLSTGEVLFDMQSVRVSLTILTSRATINTNTYIRIKFFGRSYFFIQKN